MTNPAEALAALAVEMGALPAVLIEVALKGTMLLGVAMAAALLLRRSTATMRHMVWSMSLAGLLIVPVLALVLPAWSVPLLPASLAPATTGTQAMARRATVDVALPDSYTGIGLATADDNRAQPATSLLSSKNAAADGNATTTTRLASNLSLPCWSCLPTNAGRYGSRRSMH